MKNLGTNWLTHGLIDFEYKKYELLAYLKNVGEQFSESKLYPFLGDLIFHYNNILSLKNKKQSWFEQFPESIKGVDLKKLQVTYERIINDDELMNELEEIMNFAIPRIQRAVSDGAEIYEYVESMVDVTPIGLSPIYKDEGYVFILEAPKNNMKIFRYSLKFFESPSEKYRGIETKLMDEHPHIKFKNLENEKLMLVKKYKDLPNPATYLLTSKGSFPFEETLMPVAKRFLVRYISST